MSVISYEHTDLSLLNEFFKNFSFQDNSTMTVMNFGTLEIWNEWTYPYKTFIGD